MRESRVTHDRASDQGSCAFCSGLPLKLLLGVLDAWLASSSRGLLRRPGTLASPSLSLQSVTASVTGSSQLTALANTDRW